MTRFVEECQRLIDVITHATTLDEREMAEDQLALVMRLNALDRLDEYFASQDARTEQVG